MRKNRIVKMVMSAAAAAYVVVMPVQAEENEEEIIIKECGDACAGPKPEGCSQVTDENTWNDSETDGNIEYDSGTGGNAEYGSETDNNAEYDSEEEYGARGDDDIVDKNIADKGGDEEDESRKETELTDESQAWEAEYSAMGEIDSGGEISLAEAEMEELIRKNGYGPHLLLLKKQEEEMGEAISEPALPPYSEEDLYVLAHAICGEGQGYPDDEQLYIGSVILNRRASGAFPDTIKGVVFQRGQYACTRDGNYYREPTEANWRNARWLLENGSILPGNVVYQARFRQGSGLYVQTRYHKYCYR